MTTAINTNSCPNTRNPAKRRTSIQNWVSRVLHEVHHNLRRSKPDFVSDNDPWASAVGQVQHLDSHVLKDIGAPRWVIDEVSRRQHDGEILNVQKLW